MANEPPLLSSFEGARLNSQTPKAVVLYTGNDISALLISNRIIKGLAERGISALMYLPKHTPSSKPDAQLPVAQDFAFFERHLLNEVVIPFFKARPPLADPKTGQPKNVAFTPDHLKKVFSSSLRIETTDDINDESVVDQIVDHENILGAISVRCYQKLSPSTIVAFKKYSKFLWNLHPGWLPFYRGLFAPVHSIANRERSFKWSLHVVDREFDSGPLIDVTARRDINFSEPAINLYTGLTNRAADMFLHKLDTLLDYDHVDRIPVPQDNAQARYYSFPSAKQYADWELLNPPVNYIDPAEVRDLYVRSFMEGNDPERGLFFKVMEHAVNAWINKRQALAYPYQFPPEFRERRFDIPARPTLDPARFRR